MTRNVFSLLIFLSALSSCKENYTPKPMGHIRIEPPEAKYMTFNKDELPYLFSVSLWTIIEMPPLGNIATWMNIDYTNYNAKIFCSYQPITPNTLDEHFEECRRLFESSVKKANAISEKVFENKENNVYGTLFLIEGETASPVQFILTDSISHFFRGALYYDKIYNPDSIAPVTEYIKKDIMELVQTFHWKN